MFQVPIYKHFARLVLLVILVGSQSCQESKKPLFRELSPQQTGIEFNNRLVIGGTPSVLEFEYMYNGAGVAVADFDLDGLEDIYFTGNMVSNRLYRNLGEWKFEDITQSSRTGSTHWSNGVAIVDINQDGYPDIYVCRGGPRGSEGKDRANLLFINKGLVNGELQFEEAAAQWGLDDQSYSVQAAFFDYDQDGDLDMYLLSNALVDFNRNTSRPKDRSGKAPSADKLYRNNGDQTFTDISASAGVLIEGFGLGVEVCDMNADGWPDVYVSNDFLTDDLLYINQKDGTFSNEIAKYFRHLTFNGMGNDIADINNDGNMDVVVLDMLPPDNKRWKLTMMGNNYDEFETGQSYGYQPQYIRNTLQLNNGNGSFSEVGQLAGISATEWSWSALFADYDQDGLKDLCITNGYRQDITNLDFMVYGNQILAMGTEEANRKQRLEALNKLPGIKIHNYFYRNKGNLQFEDASKTAGFTKPTYSNGMAYADFDNDGDLDLVMNNIDDPALLYENTTVPDNNNHYLKVALKGEAPNLNGLGAQVTLYYDGMAQRQYFTPYRGYLSTVTQKLHFGLGPETQIDSLAVTWPSGLVQVKPNIAVDQELTLFQKEAMPRQPSSAKLSSTIFQENDSLISFKHQEDDFVDYKIQALLPHMHSRNGPGMAVGDVNNDQKEDLYVGGALGQSGTLHTQQADGSFQTSSLTNPESEDMGALFLDADNDGDQDLYVVSGGSSKPMGDASYQDRLYVNEGAGNFQKTDALPDFRVSGSVVTAADYDQDGDLDLFVGGRVRPGEYPLPPASMLLQNQSTPGQIKYVKDAQALNNELAQLGMVTAALWTDFDDDGWQDLIVVGEFMPVTVFQNNKGTLTDITGQTGLKNTHGWWNGITSGDFDNDGDTDYVLGNLGLNSRFKATAREPLCIYANDYDKNGQIDPVMCYYIDGENYVAHSRNDLIDQINAMRSRFRNYEDYANATFEESFLKEEIATAHVVKSETFANSYLENLGGGKFRLSELPRTAQIAPMYGMLVGDYNGDRNLDLLAVGNFYSGEVFSGRYDASIGWLLAGNGKGGFDTIAVDNSGFFVVGDAKGLVNLYTGAQELLVASRNNAALKTFARTVANKTYLPKTNEIAAIVQYKDGKRQKIEFHFGSGYLSQPSRRFQIPSDAVSVKIIDDKGHQTEILPMP
jgi:hypothetical protein